MHKRSSLRTHKVTNQSEPFVDIDLFATDRPLLDAVEREAAGSNAKRRLSMFGLASGSATAFELGRLANENPPKLRTFDAKGFRRDIVEYHQAYHDLMARSFSEGLHCSPFEHLASPGSKAISGANVIRAAGFYMAAQMETGHCCPITMTHAAVPTLQLQPDVAKHWLPQILQRTYDPSFQPAANKSSVTIGMGMTEKQGGTDVRINTTRAEPATVAGPGREYLLTGHKWFMSAPMSDAFLVLAQAKGGLSCFLLPRFRPDGEVNALAFQRLKEKLGNRSNASSEVELDNASAWLIGDEGRGVASIIEMVTRTRLDCAIASTGLMRLSLATALHHARQRVVMQKPLADQPLMREVLSDMALDVEAAIALVFRLARAFDRAEDPRASAFVRLMTPVIKYWVCKIAPNLVYEAMECMGGNGYVEEGPLARIYREVPVNAIWEGSGNVMAMDVLRVLQREPEAMESVLEDLTAAVGNDPHLKAGITRIEAILHEPRLLDRRGRALAEALAVTAAGAILRAHAPQAIADAFIATRMAGRPGHTYGIGLDWADHKVILERVLADT